MKGQVKWFNDTKGFGFITPNDGGEDLFVHQSAISSEGFRSLGENEEVEFEVEHGGDGRTKAVNVTGPDGGPVVGGGRGGGGWWRGVWWWGGWRWGYGGGGGGGSGCFKCGEEGHLARDCYQSGGGGGGGDRYGGRYGGGGGGGGGGGCYNCGEEGHFSRECPTGRR
ncbi:hypothetical protein Leryth_012059 [Lithospermum erythrorhizon]|nr:hypothetical protein Leryth_012059 [Lithospermum erythrorhizon]